MMLDRREIAAVFLDAVGTLFEVRGSVGEIYSRFAGLHGVKAEPSELEKAFTRSFRSQPPLVFPARTGEHELKSLEFNWWRALVREVFAGFDFPHFDQFFAEVFEFFRTEDAWRLFDDVLPALEWLKHRGLRLAVISNFDSRIDDLLEGLGLDPYFDAVFISTRVGAAKPDPLIFRAALNHFQLEPDQTLHIGDNLREDVEGAKAAGIEPILLDRNDRFADNPRVWRIVSLDQLYCIS